MLLSQLAKVTEHTLVGEDREIANIEYDSRKVHEGDLFCCVTGTFSDGHEYAPMAKELGAAALVVAVILAYRGKSLIVVALSSSAAVLVVEWAMSHL